MFPTTMARRSWPPNDAGLLMPKVHRGRPPTYSYPIGVVPSTPPPAAAEPSEEPESPTTPTPPAASARIAAWRTYAESVGVDTAGLTKAQIRKAVS